VHGSDANTWHYARCTGDLTIDKEYRGARLFCRLGRVSQEEAETVLRVEMLRLESELNVRMHAPRSFAIARHDTLQNRHISGPPTRSRGM
jgi:hypothetical protein